MPLPTTAIKTPINVGFSTLRKITISGSDSAMTLIMKARTVPNAAPLPSSASMTGTRLWIEMMYLIESSQGLFAKSFVKGLTNGGVLGSICCVAGLTADSGAEGIQKAVSRGVIAASFAVIINELAWAVIWPGL